jgi:hypothetical protein
MNNDITHVIKKSGEKAKFSKEKLRLSLLRSGADEKTVSQIMDRVRDYLYQGIPTQEIYNKAMSFLIKEKSHYGAKYGLKKAIYGLGPTGFPFEIFISALLTHSGYKTKVGQIIQGKCVSHEVDVWAQKNNEFTPIECKFHSEEGIHCNVKIPLYIRARFDDISSYWMKNNQTDHILKPGWVVTNTRFSGDAQRYGRCSGLYLLGWDSPSGEGLKERIDEKGLYPITVSTLMSEAEKQALLNQKIVLCRQLLERLEVLENLGFSDTRIKKISHEMNQLMKNVL